LRAVKSLSIGLNLAKTPGKTTSQEKTQIPAEPFCLLPRLLKDGAAK
jgi:hypothetical protein